MALTGVGNAFGGGYRKEESLLSGGLATDALGSVVAVGLSSSAMRGRPAGGSIRRAWPRYCGRGSRLTG